MMSNSGSAPEAPADALKGLLIEVARLHHHAAAASRQLAGPDDLTNAQVSVLRSLAAQGPRTVPELARERAIARQPVQRLADGLAARGWLRFEPNPRHKRSRRLALTRAGRRRLAAMERRQTAWCEAVAGDLSAVRLAWAARLLARVRTEITRRVRGGPGDGAAAEGDET